MQPGTKCSILHMNHSAHTKVQGPKHIGSRDLRGELQNHFFSSKSEIAHQCAGAIARGQNRRPIGSWGGQPKGPHGDFHTAQSTEPQLGSATQIIIVSRALGIQSVFLLYARVLAFASLLEHFKPDPKTNPSVGCISRIFRSETGLLRLLYLAMKEFC